MKKYDGGDHGGSLLFNDLLKLLWVVKVNVGIFK